MDEITALKNEAEQVDAEIKAASAPIENQQPAPVISSADESRMIVNLLADGVSRIWPVLQYDQATRAAGAVKLAPLLDKYNISSDLLQRWGVEIEAGLFFGGLIFAGIATVQESKRNQTKLDPAPDEQK